MGNILGTVVRAKAKSGMVRIGTRYKDRSEEQRGNWVDQGGRERTLRRRSCCA